MPLPPAFRNTLHRLQRNHLALALVLVVLLIIWLVTGDIFRAQDEAPEQKPAAEEETAFRVETSVFNAEPHSPIQVVQGELIPLREVEIRSKTSAQLDERKVEWGTQVKQGDILFRLQPEARAAELARADAALTLSRAEVNGGEVLYRKQLLSEVEFLRLKSAAAAALAVREQSALELEYAQIPAPFSGIIDRLPVQEGDYIQVGQTLATLIDISVLRLIAYVPQQQAYALRAGLDVDAVLLDGTSLTGTLTFVASMAESSTRSFRVEAHIDNPELRRIAGSSATLNVRLSDQKAHRLSPALLTLSEDGRVGVKSVSAEQTVEFIPVSILSFDPEGVWVGGLPEQVDIITLGGGFVAPGDQINPVSAETP